MDDDVPIFNLNAKTKLKNFSFATSVSSLLFQNFSKEPSQTTIGKLDARNDAQSPSTALFSDSNIFEKLKVEQLKKSALNEDYAKTTITSTNSELRTSVKRSRDTNEAITNHDEIASTSQINKKSKTTTTTSELAETNETKRKKPAFNDNNYRKLNMKTFRFKGKGGKFNSKGAKYKRFMWKKNKFKSQFGPSSRSNNNNDDDDDDFNLNLIGIADSAQKQSKDDDDFEINHHKESNEAVFSRLANSKQTTSDLEANSKTKTKSKSPSKKSILKEKNTLDTDTDDAIAAKNNKPKTKRNTNKKKANEEETKHSNGDLCENETPEANDQDVKNEDEESKKKSKKKTKAKKAADHESEDDEKAIISESQIIEPVFQLDSNGDVIDKIPDYVYKMLEKDFGHKSFKPNQAEAIMRICSGLSTLVVLSTGYGKSLIYQMAARLYAKKYPGALVLVVSPLISLMQDQLHNLSKCLKAAVCDSTMSEKDYELMLHDLNHGKINILYMSPEAIMNKKIKKIPRLAFVCIDEVHCLSQWSHNFRPSYLQICQLLSDFYNVKCILGLTATATQQTIEEIGSFFSIEKQKILLDCNLPCNLIVSVSRDANKERALVELLRSVEFEPFFNHVIIYCSRREQTEKIAQLLRLTFQSTKKLYTDLSEIEKRPRGLTSKHKSAKITDQEEKSVAEAYHAGLTNQQRRRIQNDFIKGKLRVIVATMAFGMGINMSNIRSVIHYNMPKSIENYVQEIGRAGRDGQISRCHLFLETQPEDINEIKKYIHMNGYDQKTIKKLILQIFETCTSENCKYFNKNTCESYSHQVALPIDILVEQLDIKEETILTLLCYLQSAKKVKILQNCYKYCTIKSYKGANYLQDLARKSQFVEKVLKQNEANSFNSNEFTIEVSKVCQDLDQDYDVVRPQLKRLEWQIDEYGTFKAKSGISIEFQTKSFYLKRKCILDESELDELIDHLWERVRAQMSFSHSNFKALYKIVSENAFRTVDDYLHSDQMESKSNTLKDLFNRYFNNSLNLDEFTQNDQLDYEKNQSGEKEKHALANIKKFIYTYEKEAKLTGTVIARIFHGISTPKYPAEVWGRNRNFWRAHLDIEFERLTRLCTQQLLNY